MLDADEFLIREFKQPYSTEISHREQSQLTASESVLVGQNTAQPEDKTKIDVDG